jgi:hypothetical protein
MTAQVPLTVYRGDDHHWTFTLWTDAGQTVPYDLTGATAAGEVRAKGGDPVIATLTCTVTQPNTVDVDLPAAESANITKAGASVWDLELTFAGPPVRVRTVIAGAVVSTDDITGSTRP